VPANGKGTVYQLEIAQTREEKIWEAADLLYFWSVLLAKEGIKIDDVLNELRRRRRK